MKCKVHWLIDGLVEIEADNIDNAEKIIKDKIEAFIKHLNILSLLHSFRFLRLLLLCLQVLALICSLL